MKRLYIAALAVASAIASALSFAAASLHSISGSFSAFLAPVSGSVQGFLNAAEIGRAFAASLGSSSVIGFLVAFLSFIGTDAAAQSTATGALGIGFIAFVATHAAELLRRLGQGEPPATLPAQLADTDVAAYPLLHEHGL